MVTYVPTRAVVGENDDTVGGGRVVTVSILTLCTEPPGAYTTITPVPVTDTDRAKAF